MDKSPVIHKTSPFWEGSSQYMVAIMSCQPTKMDPLKEPILTKYSQTLFPVLSNFYENPKYKRELGKSMILGNLILIGSQFYAGPQDYPTDNKKKRLDWFIDALDEIAEIDGLKSIGFPSQIARDGGGNWSQYYQAITDFAKTIHLKAPGIEIAIYSNPIADEGLKGVQTQVSLINCINLKDIIPVENLYIVEQTKANSKSASPAKEVKIVVEPSRPEADSIPSQKRKIALKEKQIKEAEEVKEMAKEESREESKNKPIESSSSPKTKTPVKLKLTPKKDTQKLEEAKLQPLDELPEEPVEPNKTPVTKTTKPLTIKKKNEPIPKPELYEEPSIESDGEPPPEPKTLPESKTPPQKTKTPPPEPKIPEAFYPQTKMNPEWQTSLVDALPNLVHPSWLPIFQKDFMIKELHKIDEQLRNSLTVYGDELKFLPAYPLIFNAFKLCPFDQMKAVILGQDPYFSNTNEAMGLSFSVPKGVPIPSSLQNIFKEIQLDYEDYQIPKHGDLSFWAEQGVLLLNTALTVIHGKKTIHMDIWKDYTDKLIELISTEAPHALVFMLWGKTHAQKKEYLINGKKHLILRADHPSGLSANRGGWFNQNHFSKCNEKLEKLGLDMVDWQTGEPLGSPYDPSKA